MFHELSIVASHENNSLVPDTFHFHRLLINLLNIGLRYDSMLHGTIPWEKEAKFPGERRDLCAFVFARVFAASKLIAAADRRYQLMTPPGTVLINWQTTLAPRTGTCPQSANGACLVFPTFARRSLSLNDDFCPLWHYPSWRVPLRILSTLRVRVNTRTAW